MVKLTHQAIVQDDAKSRKADETMHKMEQASIEEAAFRLAAKNGLPYIDLALYPVETDDLVLIPESDAKRLGIVLFQRKGAAANVAMTNPADTQALAYLQDLASQKGWQISIYAVSQPGIEHAWRNYSHRTLIDNLDLVRVSLSGEDLNRFESDFGELMHLHEDSPITASRAMEVILAGANKLDASDIHLEPSEENVRLRYRIDGVLQDIGTLPNDIYHLLVSRIKMISKMRINIRDKAQDGHFFINLNQSRIDIRVNIIPGKYGESVNMRLLSNDDIVTSITDLGLRGRAYDEVLRQIEKPSGIILNTGPTGSGKTTTLYSILAKLNTPETKIITVEDPIEYSLPGIVQTEVSKDKAYTFATALRAIVRQDPDILLVGEIRDDETADIAINAALTGHLVLSTLHANSAAAAIPRLIELGVRPSLITASLNIMIAQRLVRKLCPHCKESYRPAKETLDSIVKLITIISPKANVSLPQDTETLWKAVGCPKCHFTGYRGRIGIFEILTMNQGIIELINNGGTEQDIFKMALEDGMITMTQDGILKTLEGITTLEEVSRVANQTDILQNIYLELMQSDLSRSAFVSEELYTAAKNHLSSLKAFAEYALTTNSQTRLQAIFAAAISLHASDIHVEPTDKIFDVRLRIDGILQSIAQFPINEYPSFIGEIKTLAGLKTNERAGIADNRFSITLEKSEDGTLDAKIDVRLSIISGGFGETAVMRLLNQGTSHLDLTALNIRKENLTKILRAIDKPSGIILNTGPTGSGKTTTLYSILAKLNTPETKIITVEDPIEYQMPGLLQTQVNENEGYSFSTALRSLLRQNPDIMMIGEIRDDETAQIAVQAASTGHLVLSTLHANSAAGTVSRILKMGVSGDDLANAGNLFIAQRLVRRICPACKKEYPPTDEEKNIVDSVLSTISNRSGVSIPEQYTLSKGAGCNACNGTGYSGQLMVSEALPVDNDIRDLISRNALTHELEEKARENGMITLTQDGILAAIEGRTTLEEVRRVTEL
jgi:type IV pilus assembly protein PilB